MVSCSFVCLSGVMTPFFSFVPFSCFEPSLYPPSKYNERHWSANPRCGVPQWGYDANTKAPGGHTSTRAHSSRTRFVVHMINTCALSCLALCLLACTNRRLAHHPSIVHCSCCLAGTVGSVRYSRYILRNVPDGKSGRGKPWWWYSLAIGFFTP